MADESSLQRHRSSFIVHRLLLTLLFLAPRLALLFTRQPFFDELYTRWIGAKSFGGIVAALHYDSGPPLYYFLVHLLGDPSVPLLLMTSKVSVPATRLELKERVAEALPTYAAGRAGLRAAAGSRRSSRLEGGAPLILAGVLFVPGFLLAAHQPAAAMAWA